MRKKKSFPKKSSPRTLQVHSSVIWYLVFHLVWVVVVLILSEFITAPIVLLAFGGSMASPLAVLVYYITSYGLGLFLILYGTHRIWPKISEKITPTALGVSKFPTLTDIGLAPIGYVVYLVIATLLTALMSLLPWFVADQAQELGFSHFISGWDRIFAIIALVFVAPICEELVMRGFLYGKLREKAGVFVSMLLTGLAFAVLHGQWNVAITTFVLSFILCGLREITGSIWSGLFLHILVNGIAFYAVYVVL